MRALLAALVVGAVLVAPVALDSPSNPGRSTLAKPGGTLAFEPAAGRYGNDVQFLSRRGDYALGLMKDGSAVLSTDAGRIRTRLIGARIPRTIVPERELPGIVNSYVGRDRSKWRTGLPTYGAIRYTDVYPGVDLRYHGRQGLLEYDYVVRPGADPSPIAIGLRGGTPRLTPAGDLVVGQLRQRRPVAYQQIDGRRVRVEAAFELSGHRVAFRLGHYDRSHRLVIDPQLLFATYLGGAGADHARAIKAGFVGGATSVFVGGYTRSPNFHGSNDNAGGFSMTSDDAFISRMSDDGSTVLATTFIGGSQVDSLTGLDVGDGRVFVAGGTNSNDMPVGIGLGTPLDSHYDAGDGWLARLEQATLTLDVLTYTAKPVGAVTYKNQTVYSGGYTSTGGLAAGGYDTTANGGDDGFIAAYSANLSTTLWSTYFGGSGSDYITAIATSGDPADDNVYVAGYTVAPEPNFPVTIGSGVAQNLDAFAASFSPDGTTLNGSTLYGGADYDVARALTVKGTNLVAIGGSSSNSSLPGIAGSRPGTDVAGFDGFVIALGLTNLGGTFGGAWIGGNGTDEVEALALDPFAGAMYAVGDTASTDLPTTNPVQAHNAGGNDMFVARVSGPSPAFLTYLGGSGSDSAKGVAVLPPQVGAFPAIAYVAGDTTSTDLAATATFSPHATANPVQPTNAGNGDTFVARIQPKSAVIVSGPAEGSTVSSSTADFTFGPTDETPPGYFTCTLNTDAKINSFDLCPTNKSFTNLADGPHTLRVAYHENGGGNTTDGTVAVRHWTVNTAGPPVLGEPSGGSDLSTTKPTFKWSAPSGPTPPTSYDVEIDGKSQALALSPSTLAYTPTSSLDEGLHAWRVVANNPYGAPTRSDIGIFRIDVTPPNAQLSASPNPMLAGHSVTLDASSSNDPAGGRIVHYEWDLDGDGTFEFDGGTTPTTTKGFNASGAYLMGVQVTDPIGQKRSAYTTLIVTTPPVPAGQLGVTVNNGDQYTKSADVTLNLNFPTTTSQLLVSNDGGFLAPTTFVPKKTIDWKLDSSGPERLPKTVYVRFLLNGIVSETYTDDIILDETPPVVEQLAVTPASTAAARAAAVRTFKVKLKATDSNSGVNAVQITANKSKPGRFLKYKTSLTVKATTRKLFARARDRAGNLSAWKKAR